MIYVGIDVAKDKHDCIIVDSDGVICFPTFTILNNKQGLVNCLQISRHVGVISLKLK
jgi:transposase